MSATVRPPEELLSTPPKASPQDDPQWTVVARNRKVNRDWEVLISRWPENAARWYQYLRTTPTQRWPGRVFPLKGAAYKGVWECEIASGDRLFYVPSEVDRKVVVYYAGGERQPAPKPPK